MTPISVVIPIGPNAEAGDYFDAAVRSVLSQTQKPHSIVIVDDMAVPIYTQLGYGEIPVYVERNKWRLGIPNAFNVGISVARTECVLMMGADDWLEPDCLEQCSAAFERSERRLDSYYWLGVRYSDGREDQFLPCGAAMVTKSLWQRTGGFAPESAVGAVDAAFISSMLVRPEVCQFVPVNKDRPLYNYRVHSNSETASRGAGWQGVILDVRDLLTSGWQEPAWGRYE